MYGLCEKCNSVLDSAGKCWNGYCPGKQSSRSPGCSKSWILALRPAYAVSRGMFSRSDHKGYTNDIDEAGRFSEVEALERAVMYPDKYVVLELAKP